MTRLLKTAIIGPSDTIVDSSWIDMLAGLSPWGILRMPPGFCATAAPEPATSTSPTSIAAHSSGIILRPEFITCSPAAARSSDKWEYVMLRTLAGDGRIRMEQSGLPQIRP